jgi:predicted dehydrogenase
MDKVGIGIIGLGFGRAVQIPGFLSLADVPVVGAWSPRREIAEATSKEFSLPKRFDSWEDMVRNPDIAAVSIATPPEAHRSIVEAAVTSGKAVLCEKPFGIDAQDAAGMLSRIEAARLVHMVDFELREIPAFIRAKEIIEAGELGAIRHVDVRWFVSSWSDFRRPWSWRSERLGAGVLGALGVHSFDYIEWWCGQITQVLANLQTHVKERPDSQGNMRAVQSEDSAQLLMNLSSGASVSLQLSNVATINRGHWVEIFGEKKHLRIGSGNPADYGKDFSLWESDVNSSSPREVTLPALETTTDGRVALFARLAGRFVDCVRNRRTGEQPSFKEGWRSQLILDAVLRSARQQEWVQM